MEVAMHYKNGREVKLGDRFICKTPWGVTAGIVVGLQPQAETCNVQYVPLGTVIGSETASKCLHVDDLSDFKEE